MFYKARFGGFLFKTKIFSVKPNKRNSRNIIHDKKTTG